MHSLEIEKLRHCTSAIERDRSTFGISCVKNLLDVQKIRHVEHSTDIARLKKQAKSLAEKNSDVVVIHNATLLTMASGHEDIDLIQDGVLLVRGGVIESVGSVDSFSIPPGATVISANGGMFRGFTIYCSLFSD